MSSVLNNMVQSTSLKFGSQIQAKVISWNRWYFWTSTGPYLSSSCTLRRSIIFYACARLFVVDFLRKKTCFRIFPWKKNIPKKLSFFEKNFSRIKMNMSAVQVIFFAKSGYLFKKGFKSWFISGNARKWMKCPKQKKSRNFLHRS